jgi:hypothetical protein
MSYYYGQKTDGTGTTQEPTGPVETIQVGSISQETIYASNINNSSWNDTNFAFNFSFLLNEPTAKSTTSITVIREPVPNARIHIFKSPTGNISKGWTEIQNPANLVATVDILYGIGSNSSTNQNSEYTHWGSGGYGHTYTTILNELGVWKLKITGFDIPKTIYTTNIDWKIGYGFVGNSTYFFKVKNISANFNLSQTTTSSNDYYGFGVLKTLPATPPAPVSFKPLVFNINASDITLEPLDLVSVKLNGSYKYITSPLQIANDRPKEAGFAYREVGTTNWNYLSALAITLQTNYSVSTTPINFSLVITGLSMGKQYEYTSYVKIDTNDKYLSRDPSTPTSTDSTTSISSAFTTLFITPNKNVTAWVDPNIGTTWYQIYDDWELVENATSGTIYPKNKIFPFFKVRNLSTVASPLLHDSNVLNFPLFYYFNKAFNKDKTYKFRTIVENFYTGRITGPIISEAGLSNFTLNAPWGENFNYSNVVPYFPIVTGLIPDNLKLINLYLFTNINSFGSTINKVKPIDNFISKNNPQNPVYYSANSYFSNTNSNNTSSSLLDFNISESDWITQGFAPFSIMNNGSATTTLNLNDDDEVIPVYIGGQPIGGKGWHFLDKKGQFIWFDKYNSSFPDENINNLPIGGDINDYFYNKTSNHKYLQNNFIARYVSFQTFNLNFDYTNQSNFKLKMYVGVVFPQFDNNNKYDLDKLITDGLVKELATLGKSNLNLGTTQSCEFVGVTGNQYIFFVADPVYKHTDLSDVIITSPPYISSIDNTTALTTTTYSVITISNFKISGSYNDSNNENFDVNMVLPTYNFRGIYDSNIVYYKNDVVESYGKLHICILGPNVSDFGSSSWSPFDPVTPYSTTTPISNATYSIKLGVGNNVVPGAVNNVINVYSLSGNGRFNSGIWENGVWNNGWREDLTKKDFYKIDKFYSYEQDKKWRVQISGPVSSIVDTQTSEDFFKIGDKVSISNMIAIDINEERKLLKKYYNIIEATHSVSNNYIEVEFENDFPLRRIEIDSDEHRIGVSKNVWLSGVFLNGYFKGIWNNGLFSGYPLITKMDESHWIDGIFNGGHFTANKYSTTFSMVFPYDINNVTRLGLSFSTPHKLTTDDIISINPNTYTYNYKAYNNSLGSTIVIEVIDEYRLVTGINWQYNYLSISNGGKIYSIISSGLIQNFDFYSNNVSSVTSLQSLKSENVFQYNSWIDVNYSNQTAVNIGKPQSFLDKTSNRSYSENNLYGYPTNDILSSNSVFRDSFSTSFRKYKLGKKWKIFDDYVGDSSSFEEYFDSSDTTNGLEEFNIHGWQFDITDNNIIEIPINTAGYISRYDNPSKYITQYLRMEIINNNKIILDNIKVGDNLSINAWKTKNPFNHDNNGNIAYKNTLDVQSNQVTDTTWNHGEITRVKINLVVSEITVGTPGGSILATGNTGIVVSEYVNILFNKTEGSTYDGSTQPQSSSPTITQTELDDAKNLLSNDWQYLTYGYDPKYAEYIGPTTNLLSLGYTDKILFGGPFAIPSWLVLTGSSKNLDLSNYIYNWSIDLNVHNGLTFSRTPEPLDNSSTTIGKELKIDSFGSGGVLNLTPAYDVANRSNGTDKNTIEKFRYSIIEFDLLKYNSATYSYQDQKLGNIPSIYFNNLNFVTRNIINSLGTQSVVIPATYLPINKNVNHLLTRNKKKQEFFFNKRNLLFNFRGTGLNGLSNAEYYLDNIKLYEVNMIPFFQYFINPIGTTGNINKSVQIPNNGSSPIINFTEDNLIDSDNDSIITFFSNNLIASNVEIPSGINWQRDYSIYRTQISGNDILGSDDPYLTI